VVPGMGPTSWFGVSRSDAKILACAGPGSLVSSRIGLAGHRYMPGFKVIFRHTTTLDRIESKYPLGLGEATHLGSTAQISAISGARGLS
jgi:hypothetical protein